MQRCAAGEFLARSVLSEAATASICAELLTAAYVPDDRAVGD